MTSAGTAAAAGTTPCAETSAIFATVGYTPQERRPQDSSQNSYVPTGFQQNSDVCLRFTAVAYSRATAPSLIQTSGPTKPTTYASGKRFRNRSSPDDTSRPHCTQSCSSLLAASKSSSMEASLHQNVVPPDRSSMCGVILTILTVSPV